MTQNNLNARNLNPFKRLKFEDILSFAHKTNKVINYKFLRDNGFDPTDIDIIYENNELEVLKNNCRVLELKIKRLSKQLLEKNSKIRKTNTPPAQIKKPTEYIEDKNWWTVINHYKSGRCIRLVKKSNIIDLHKIIKKNTGNTHNIIEYREIVSHIIKNNKLYNLTVDGFNGGKNRKLYFDLFYYPSKVLEHLGDIKLKQGKIERLK